MRAVAIALVLTLGGCATSQTNTANRTIAAGLDIFTTVGHSLDAAMMAEENHLEDQVRAGNLTPDDAIAQYTAWMKKAKKAAQALIVYWDALKTASHVNAAVAAKLGGDLPAAMANLISAFQDLVAALSDMGLHISGVN